MVSIGKAFKYTVIVLYTGSLWFILGSFLFMFPFTTAWINAITTPTAYFFGLTVIYVGVIFLVDLAWSTIDLSGAGALKRNVTFGALIFAGMSIFSIIMGILIFFNQYRMDNTTINFGIMAVLGLGCGSVVWHSRSVLFSRKPIIATVYDR